MKKRTLDLKELFKPQAYLIGKRAVSPFHHSWNFSFTDENPVQPFGIDDENQHLCGVSEQGDIQSQQISLLMEVLVLITAKRKAIFRMTNGNEQKVNGQSEECSAVKILPFQGFPFC